jgi:hypothetical protein
MTLVSLILTSGVTAGFFIWLIIYLFVLHQEKGERLIGWLAKFIAWTGKKAEKTATAMNIQGKLNSFVAAINTEVEGLLPYGLKIKWISSELNRESFISDDKVVVMLDFHSNQDENLSKATVLYMNKAVIPEARPHIHFKLGKAIDLMMAKKALFSFVEARSSFGYFVNSVLRPEMERDQELKDFCQVIDATDERGLFTRVLLRELLELGRRRAGITEIGDTVLESNNFTKFLKEIAQKEKGQNVPLTFIGRDIKVAIILVARFEVEQITVDPFIKRIKEKIQQSVNVIYIFARGQNIRLAKQVMSSCESMPELTKIHEEEFPTHLPDGEIVIGFCAIFYNRKTI